MFLQMYLMKGIFKEKGMLKKVFQELNCTVAVVALSIRRRQYFH
jgi:hypothetical protein